MNIIDEIHLKFKSGNSVPIDRIWLSKEDWASVLHVISLLTTTNEVFLQMWKLGINPQNHDKKAQDG